MNSVDEELKRFAFQSLRMGLPWLALFVLVCILIWLPIFITGYAWLWLLLVLVFPLGFYLEKSIDRKIEAVRNALPEEAKEELKRRMAYGERMKRKFTFAYLLVMILGVAGLFAYSAYTIKKKHEAAMQWAVEIQPQGIVPAPK